MHDSCRAPSLGREVYKCAERGAASRPATSTGRVDRPLAAAAPVDGGCRLQPPAPCRVRSGHTRPQRALPRPTLPASQPARAWRGTRACRVDHSRVSTLRNARPSAPQSGVPYFPARWSSGARAPATRRRMRATGARTSGHRVVPDLMRRQRRGGAAQARRSVGVCGRAAAEQPRSDGRVTA